MIKLSKKFYCCIILIFTLIAFLCGNYFFKETPNSNLFLYALFGIISLTYLIYIFSPIKKFYAYISAFISTIIIDIAFFWSLCPILLYYENRYSHESEAIPDIVIDAYVFMMLPIILNALIFSLIYWIIYYIQKKKHISEEERTNVNGK